MKSHHLAVAVLTSIAPMSVFALGIGNMIVSSSLNEPFDAQIPLRKLNTSSLSGLNVSLASVEDYEKIGLERHDVLASFLFEIKKDKHGVPSIHILTQERVTEPYFELLIRIVTTQGEFFRQYPILLDPPDYTQKGRPVHSKIMKIKGQQVCFKAQDLCDHPISYIEKINLKQTTHSSIQSLYNSFSLKELKYGPTLPEDSIWDIAAQYQKSDMSVNQVVLAIVGTNSKAFTQGNLNGLKTGEQLQIPNQNEIKRIPKELASQEVMAHEDAWKFKQEIQHVLLPPYLHGVRGNSQFDAPLKLSAQIKNTISRDSSRTGNVVPHSVMAFNQQTLAKKLNSNSQMDITSMSDNQTLNEAYRIIKSATSDMNQLKTQFNALQTENKKLAIQIKSLAGNYANLQKEVEKLIKDKQAHAGASKTSQADHSIISRLIDFLMMIGSFISGIFTLHFITSRQKHVKSDVAIPSAEIDQSPNVSDTLQETEQPKETDQRNPSQAPSLQEDTAPTASIDETISSSIPALTQTIGNTENQLLKSKEDQDSSQQAPINFQNEPSITKAPFYCKKTIQPNEYLIQFDFIEPANNAPVQMPQPLSHSVVQEAINAPLEPQTTSHTTNPFILKSVSDESNVIIPFVDQIISSPFTESENNVSIQFQSFQSSQPIQSIETPSITHSDDNLVQIQAKPEQNPEPPLNVETPLKFKSAEQQEIITETQSPTANIDQEPSLHLIKSTAALETLFDLAKAYLSMCDKDGAIQALEEIIQHGNADQKTKAQTLMNDLR